MSHDFAVALSGDEGARECPARSLEVSRWALGLVGLLALTGMTLSAYLAMVSMGWVELAGCASGSCTRFVLASQWSHWMGVPVGFLAILIYIGVLTGLVMSCSSQPRRRLRGWLMLLLLATIILGAAFWFVGLMTVHLRKSCGHCLGLHMLGTVIASTLFIIAPVGNQPNAIMSTGRMARSVGLGMVFVALLAGTQLLAAAAGSTRAPEAESTAQEADASTDDALLPAADRGATVEVSSQPELTLTRPGSLSAATAASALAEQQALLGSELMADYDPDRGPTNACQFMFHNASRPGVQTTSTGLHYEVLRAGAGKTALATDRVRLRYTGQYWSGQVFADRQIEEIIVSDLIPGLAEAVTMMREGARWRLVLLPHLAYGLQGLPGYVPPDMHLVYDVELLKILPSASIVRGDDGRSPLTTEVSP